MIAASARTLFREKGVNRRDLQDPRSLECLGFLKDAPDDIRNADFLSLEERAGLWMLRPGEGVPDDVFRRAQLKTIETLRTRHEFLTGQTVPETVAQLEAMWQGESIKDILNGHIRDLLRKVDVAAQVSLFSDREKLTAKVIEEARALQPT